MWPCPGAPILPLSLYSHSSRNLGMTKPVATAYWGRKGRVEMEGDGGRRGSCGGVLLIASINNGGDT